MLRSRDQKGDDDDHAHQLRRCRPPGSFICGRHWFLPRLLCRRPSGRIPLVPPTRHDGPPFLTFAHCLRFYSSSQTNSVPVRGPTTDGIFLPFVHDPYRKTGTHFSGIMRSRMTRSENRCPLFRDHAFALSWRPSLPPRTAATMPGPLPANLLSVFPENLAARLFAH